MWNYLSFDFNVCSLLASCLENIITGMSVDTNKKILTTLTYQFLKEYSRKSCCGITFVLQWNNLCLQEICSDLEKKLTLLEKELQTVKHNENQLQTELETCQHQCKTETDLLKNINEQNNNDLIEQKERYGNSLTHIVRVYVISG